MAKKDNFMSGMGGLALWVILKGMMAKPIEPNWGSVIVGFLLGGYLIQANIPCKNDIDAAAIFGGCYSILLAIAMLLELIETKRKQRELDAQREEEEKARRTAERRARRVQSRAEERQARATELANALAAHQPTYTASPVAAYAPAEESPVSAPAEPVSAVAAPSVSTPAIAPATDEEEERDENENNSPTPPAAKPLAGKRVCVTGKLPYKRKAITDFIVAMGGEVKNRPTRNTDYLVAGENCGTKLDEAEKYGVAVIDYADLLALCGLPSNADIYEAMPREFREERMRGRLSSEEAREYGREFKRRLHLLQEILTSTVSDLLPRSVQVVTQVDDELELHRVSGFRSTPRGELVLLSTEGEAIYLNDLTGDSVVRLLGLYRR